MPPYCLDSERLQAYVDDELSPPERLQAAIHLARSQSDRAWVFARQAEAERLHAAYDCVLAEPVPPRLLATARAADAGDEDALGGEGKKAIPLKAARRAGRYTGMVGVVALSFAAAVGAWMMRAELHAREFRQSATNRFLSQATSAYALYASDGTGALPEDGQEAELMRWFEKSAGVDLVMPRFAAAGYHAAAARVLPSATGLAGAFVYRNAAGTRLTLYFQTDAYGEPATPLPERNAAGKYAYTRRDELSVYYWDSGPLAYALVGKLERDALTSVAKRAGLLGG